MARHPDYTPRGVIPAVLLPFFEDLSIDEASYRSHLRDVRAMLQVDDQVRSARTFDVG